MSSAVAPPVKAPAAGLQGVVATSSEICFIDGQAGRLVYRGYEIGDLVENATFEEVAFLLWEGRLPNRAELAALHEELARNTELPRHVQEIITAMPKDALPMDVLRTAVSALGPGDPDLSKNDPAANRRKAIRLTAQFPSIVCDFHRHRTGQPRIKPDKNLSIAGNFLYMLFGKKPHETLVRVMDAALVLHAEHGMNASTFAARVIAATLSDMHAAVAGAIAALKGPLHGGANQDVMELLLACGDADTAERKVREILASGGKVPGFGHRVYRTFDPRATFLRKMSRQLGEDAGNTKWYEMSERLIPVVQQVKNIHPNVDFFSASAYYTMGIPLDLFTPIFAVARITGWTAHIMEQHRNNRIIRPTDEYTGPQGLKVVPIDKR
ncbi:MAG: citrate synthase [Phycisphaerae bacterium]|nr:citrate synthase [Phycisphaerae bacterium]MDW8263228.1 citrate/2-methylcitrate synthase [Phycisphaerales bacterium]